MRNEQFNIDFQLCSEEELSAEDRQLVELAKEATYTSFSPYSNFRVGAAVELENGERLQGSNQENASFTTGICAERCVMFYANARFPDVAPRVLAIAARGKDGAFTSQPVSPCGACRQVLAEVEHRFGKPLRVLLYGSEHVYVLRSTSTLLPFQFNSESL